MTAPTNYGTTDPTNYGNRPGDGPLRIGGQSVATLPSGPQTRGNLPSTLSPAASKQQDALTLVRDIWGGTESVRKKTTVYLPQAPAEKPGNYATRLARSVFNNIFRNTITGLVGFIYRTDPQLGDDVPARIKDDWENLDNAGTHGDVLIRNITQDAMAAGHAAILVDFPDTDGLDAPRGLYGGIRLDAEKALKIRPYWLPLLKDNILSWRTTIENGAVVLTQLVLKECTFVPDGLFGEKEQIQYRVLYRHNDHGLIEVGYVLFEIAPNNTLLEIKNGLYRNQVEIPVAEIPTSGRIGLFESDPPFRDLAYLNVAHYQMWSDYATSINKTCVPILFTAGVTMQDNQGQQLEVGPNSGIASQDPNGKALYVTHGGESLGAVKQALDDLRNDMGALGLAALASQKRASETATAKQIDKSATDSSLAVTARGVQDGGERALGFHARYYGLPSGGSLTINRDFSDEQLMDPLAMQAYGALATAIGLPVRAILEELQAGGRLSEDADLDAMEMEIMANKAAAADQAAAQQAAQLDALKQSVHAKTPAVVTPAPDPSPI